MLQHYHNIKGMVRACRASTGVVRRLQSFMLLQSKTSTECEYLGGSNSLRHAALFASMDSARGRAVYGLHLPPTKRFPLNVPLMPVYLNITEDKA